MKLLNVNVNGNAKLQNTKTVRFMIWNLPARETCPFKTDGCSRSCYAIRSERWTTCREARQRNYNETLSDDFVENMIHTIEKRLNGRAFKGKKAVFRIHESGDFYGLTYTLKWINIARHFENDNRIIFNAYTKSVEYFVKLGYGTVGFPKNFVVRASLWNDTPDYLQSTTRLYNFPTYAAVAAFPENDGYFTECRGSDCGTCLKCYSNHYNNILTLIH
jgi:hypothetical protein